MNGEYQVTDAIGSHHVKSHFPKSPWCWVMSAMVVCASAAPVVAQNHPNIIMILTDDQGVNAVQGTGWSNQLNVHTPNLAKFASNGITFTNCRVNAKCSPTRASLMTGRNPMQTGVDGVIKSQDPDRDHLSLQRNEQTIAELLREMGYRTILEDKWHCGTGNGENPESQGFNKFRNYVSYLPLDDPINVGDEHISLMVNYAVHDVLDRPNPERPYAFFFWSIDPHARHDFSGREPLHWWKVTDALLPSGEDYYNPDHDNERNRYRAVVEAQDTELGRMLRELGVVDEAGDYQSQSNTIVIFMSDNGTPALVLERNNAKGSVYDGGIHVPLFVFGANIHNTGTISQRLVSADDLYDTISDFVSAPPDLIGTMPRNGCSFADVCGYTSHTPTRQYTMSSEGDPDPTKRFVALTDGRYKVIAHSGSIGLADPTLDGFYDLLNDPYERHNLRTRLNPDLRAIYETMRDDMVDYWPAAVTRPFAHQIDVPMTNAMTITSHNRISGGGLTVGFAEVNREHEKEARGLVRFETTSIDSLLPPGKTFDDIVSAQIILAYRSDARHHNTDTGTITANPVTFDWWTDPPLWQVLQRFHTNEDLGHVDLPPFIVFKPEGGKLSGIPLTENSPVSLGHSDNLLNEVRNWYEHPDRNYGIMLSEERLTNVGVGDQMLVFQPGALLRLTFR